MDQLELDQLDLDQLELDQLDLDQLDLFCPAQTSEIKSPDIPIVFLAVSALTVPLAWEFPLKVLLNFFIQGPYTGLGRPTQRGTLAFLIWLKTITLSLAKAIEGFSGLGRGSWPSP